MKLNIRCPLCHRSAIAVRVQAWHMSQHDIKFSTLKQAPDKVCRCVHCGCEFQHEIPADMFPNSWTAQEVHVFEMLLKGSMTQGDAAKALGVSRPTVIKKYQTWRLGT